MAKPLRVIVIGAGWSGLVAAKTYLQISKSLNRPIDLTVLDDSTDPGGVWSSQRLYPGLVANSPNGLYEYSDLSMVDEEHPDLAPVPGERVQSYLESYARKFDVYSKIRFDTNVVKVRRIGSPEHPSGWTLETSKGETFECDKLIIAAGLYAKPRLPSIPQSTYTGTSIHSRALGKMHRSLIADPKVKHIVVVGGCKSSLETVSVFLPSSSSKSPCDKHITWVIRPHEMGVPIIVQDPGAKPNLVAANNTRLFSALSPSFYNTSGVWHTFLHSGTWLLGTLILNFFWSGLSFAIRKGTKYDKSINGRKIKPRGSTSMFFHIPHVSLIATQHPFLKWLYKDDFEVLEIERATPVALEGREMIARDADGEEKRIQADAIVWCTGFQPSVDFFEPEEAKNLGVPVPMSASAGATHTSLPDTASATAAAAATSADKEILSVFPSLRNSPLINHPKTAPPSSSKSSINSISTQPSPEPYPLHTPYRLYRQILPLCSLSHATADRSIAFSGLISNSQTAITSELTALWTVAWLEDLLPPRPPPPTHATASREVDLATSFQRLRYGAKGARDPEIILEIQTFLDVLCRDLGVAVERKRRGRGRGWWRRAKDWVREYVEPYRAADYDGVVDEFLQARKDEKR